MKKNKPVEEIKKAIQTIAKRNGVRPQEVTKLDLVDEGVAEWELRKVGGLKALMKACFPESDKNLKEISRLKEINSYIGSLEALVGKKQSVEELVQEVMLKNIKPIKVPKAYKFKKKGKLEREVVVSINDVHFGAIVNPEEVGGSNRYDWEVACRRMAYLAKQVGDYKIEKRGETKRLHVVINGDILQGVIHDLTARTAELLALQQVGALHILIYFISYVSQFYEEVVVHGISGNHEDSPHRREGGRVTSHKYDSALTPVLAGLSASFRNEKRIKFVFPKGLHCDVQLPGGRMLATHGDTMFSKQLGNPSTNLNVKGLSDIINRFNTGELNKGRDLVKLVLMGHVHNHVNFTTFDGIKVYIAPSLSGIDSYAHSLAINSNQTGQVIFESTKNYILGDPRLVDVLAADNDKTLDKIIPVYKNELVVK